MKKTKAFALASDIVLLLLTIGGAIWLFALGSPAVAWQTDRSLLPLVVDGSRLLMLVTAIGVVLGLIAAAVAHRRPDRVVNGDVTRYAVGDRLAHWSIALGFVLAFVTGAWLLRLFALDTTVDLRPTLYVVHFIGAGLIVLAGAAFVAYSRVRGEDALFPRWRDVGPAIARLFGYLGTYGQPGVLGLRLRMVWLQDALAAIGIRPAKREGKFLSVEKVLSFTPLAILAVIVVATGLIKAAHYFFAVPLEVLKWSTWLHDVSVWLTLIVVGLHLAAIFLVPRNWPGIRSMVTGRMRVDLVGEEFPAWADELRQREIPAQGREVPAHGTAGGGD
ncbi:MAG: cytochrome b/b6 domain-containing protein [Chloroflexota bacterium]|nr:cytochrome b/b6 domain-containing protein [Chloroflexota bacterium]